MRRPFLLITILILVLASIASIGAIDSLVTRATEKQQYTEISAIPYNKVGLVLGTSKYLEKGGINPYYQGRIDAAVQLYEAGKVAFLLLSGDNTTTQYNEPERMRRDLLARGVSPACIFMDYAGYHTINSILRCKEVFGETDITIVSQSFHNERALFIANKRGMHAIAYNAPPPESDNPFSVIWREKLSRVKMLSDLLLNKQPYYTEKIEIK